MLPFAPFAAAQTIPAFVADSIRPSDKKHSYYREHTHALASGVSADRIMAELFGKVRSARAPCAALTHPIPILLSAVS